MTHHKLNALCLVACLLLIACTTAPQNEPSNYPSPDRFENAIKAFEKADAEEMPPKGAVLCVGSSSIRMWHSDLAKDLAPLTVIGRGFGGSNTNDLLHYADRIVVNYKPRAIVIYEGDNDVAQGIEPAEILATYTRLLDKIEADLPGCRVYILAIKPSIKRWDMWPKMNKVNASFAKLAKDRETVTYLDIATPMLGDDGKPRPDLFIKDDLHLNRKGYELWRDTIRPMLVEAEKTDEQE